MLATRAEARELMDADDLSAATYAAVVGDLAKVNVVTLAARPTLAFLRRIANLRSVEHRLDDADGLFLAVLVDQNTRRGDAALTGVDEHALHRRGQDLGQIGVGQDDVRRFAA